MRRRGRYCQLRHHGSANAPPLGCSQPHHHSVVDKHPSKPLLATPPRRRRSTSAKPCRPHARRSRRPPKGAWSTITPQDATEEHKTATPTSEEATTPASGTAGKRLESVDPAAIRADPSSFGVDLAADHAHGATARRRGRGWGRRRRRLPAGLPASNSGGGEKRERGKWGTRRGDGSRPCRPQRDDTGGKFTT